MNTEQALNQARQTWPGSRIVKARKSYHCDNQHCAHIIIPGEEYIDPGDSNPERAGGFGGYRYCLLCAGSD